MTTTTDVTRARLPAGGSGGARHRDPHTRLGSRHRAEEGGAVHHAYMNKALTMKTGQTHVPRYHDELLRRVEAGEIDPSFVITHRVPIDRGPEMYKTFRDKEEGCIKVVLKPWE